MCVGRGGKGVSVRFECVYVVGVCISIFVCTLSKHVASGFSRNWADVLLIDQGLIGFW